MSVSYPSLFSVIHPSVNSPGTVRRGRRSGRRRPSVRRRFCVCGGKVLSQPNRGARALVLVTLTRSKELQSPLFVFWYNGVLKLSIKHFSVLIVSG